METTLFLIRILRTCLTTLFSSQMQTKKQETHVLIKLETNNDELI